MDTGTTKTLVENTNFHPKRPALGSLGLQLHMDKISRSPQRHWVQEPNIELDGKKWGLPPVMLTQWRHLCLKYGLNGQFDVKSRIADKIVREQNEPTLDIQEYNHKLQLSRERLWRHSYQQAELRDFAILQRAVLASSPANSLSTTSPNVTNTATEAMNNGTTQRK